MSGRADRPYRSWSRDSGAPCPDSVHCPRAFPFGASRSSRPPWLVLIPPLAGEMSKEIGSELPWAIAVGVTERWIFNFQGLKVSAPSWYLSRGDFSLPSFAHDLSSFAQRTEEAILTTRRGYADGRGAAGGGGFSNGSSGGGAGGGGGGTF